MSDLEIRREGYRKIVERDNMLLARKDDSLQANQLFQRTAG